LLRTAILSAVFVVAWLWKWNHVSICVFYNLTGLKCPGCGMTRAFHAISHGHFAEAVHFNIFSPVVYCCLMLILLLDIIYLVAGVRIRIPMVAKIEEPLAYVGIALALAYAIVRNLTCIP
jgi:hypothetical protein